jgi:hypothetical protein
LCSASDGVAVHLEAVRPRHVLREADVVQERADCHDLAIEGDAVGTPGKLREEPGAHRVIEQIRIRDPLRVFEGGADERRVGHAQAGDEPGRGCVGAAECGHHVLPYR